MYIKKKQLHRRFKKANTEYTKIYIKDMPIQDCLAAGLTPSETTCFMLLLAHHNEEKDLCNPSQALLSYEMNRSVRSIGRYIKKLKEAGLIIVKNMGKMMNNHYDLTDIIEKIKKIKEKNQEVKQVKEKINKKCNEHIKYKQKNSNWNYEGQNAYDFDNIEKFMVFGEQDE